MRREPITRKSPPGKVYVGLLIGLAATALVLLLEIVTWPDNMLELMLLDVRLKYFSRMPVSDHVVHVDIDDKSLEQLGRWPWKRRNLAKLITHCRQAGAEQVGLDILFPEEEPREVFLDGFSNIGAYEPQPDPNLLALVEPIVYDNDSMLVDAVKGVGGVATAFHAQLPRPGLTVPPEADAALRGQVMVVLHEHATAPSFKEVYRELWPHKNIDDTDPQYYQLLRAYKFCRSQKSLERFSFVRTPEELALPLRQMVAPAYPIPYFADAVDNGGFATVVTDVDSVVRRVPLLAQRDGRIYKQLAFAMLCEKLGVTDDQIDLAQPGKIILQGHDIEIPVDGRGMMLVNWTGPWEQNPNHISAAYIGQIWEQEEALERNHETLRYVEDLQFQLSTVPKDLTGLDDATIQQIDQMRRDLARLPDAEELRRTNTQLAREIAEHKNVLHDRLAGKIVLIGSAATGAADYVPTPVGPRTPGVVVHGNVIDTIMRREFIDWPPRLIEYLIIILLGAVITGITSGLRPLASALALAGMLVTTWCVNCLWFFAAENLWFILGSSTNAIIVSFTTVTFYRQVTEGRAKRMVTRRFKQYAAPAVVDKIVRSGSSVRLEGELREISCYFSDLSGFTTVSERLGPERTVSVLNIYLDRMTEVLHQHQATINKFEGDGVFAFFGAPLDMPEHARFASLAALDSSYQLGQLVTEQQQIDAGYPSLTMRVGISTGQAVVGDCGSHRRFDYTAIGDTVNLAARLESANKAFGTYLMICEHTRRQAADAIDTRYLGKVRVVGKKKDVGIYELLGRTGQVEPHRMEYAQQFAAAVHLFQQRDFDQAADAFRQCLQPRPDDKGARLYLTTAQQYLAEAPAADFTGCIELIEK